MYEIEIPNAFFVVNCDRCQTRHAPIRDCPQPEPEFEYDWGSLPMNPSY
jgi:hypothetical protein